MRDEQAVTRLAATMKSRISIVAPGSPIEKKRGEQCLMMVFTMSCETKRKRSKQKFCTNLSTYMVTRYTQAHLVLVKQAAVHDVVEVCEEVRVG